MSEDGQLRAAHLILDYEPLSHTFQDIGQAIRAGSSRLARIDVSKPGFLARKDLPPVVLPIPQIPSPIAQPPPQNLVEAATFPEEEIASSCLSLEEKIDEFRFKEINPKASLINLSYAEEESDRSFRVRTPILVITCLDNSSKEEEDDMALNRGNKNLRELMAARGKGSTSKAAPKPQAQSNLPPSSSQVPTDPGLKPNPDLKKKRLAEWLEEGKVSPR